MEVLSCNTASLNAPPIAWDDTSASPEKYTHYRTIDFQCAVNQLGVDPITLAISVKLLIALLHHPLGANAPAPDPAGGKEEGLR